MSTFPEAGFVAPPVWELALSASSGGALADPYDIRGIHDIFRTELPSVERQIPVAGLNVAAMAGGPPVLTEIELPPSRWWFISADETEVLQVQETFIASNWRRRKTPAGDPLSYPGYEHIIAITKDRFSKLRDLYGAESFSKPNAWELMYDNIIPLVDHEGNELRISDVLSEYKRVDPGRKSLGFQMNWVEKIDGLGALDKAALQIQISVVAMIRADAEPLPVIKLLFTAGGATDDWEELFQVADTSHSHIRSRFMALTTDRAHSEWLPR